jgi:hypothetical protein
MVLPPGKGPPGEEGKRCHALNAHEYEGAQAREDRAKPGWWRIVRLCDLRARDDESANAHEGEANQASKSLEACPDIVKNRQETKMLTILVS